ncbi:MAG: ABC transporter ATP-binding protein [Oscillospiraceae bacterium]|nr:ABC transporter ATP-binding protein [Oscillospiraceae bacterium]
MLELNNISVRYDGKSVLSGCGLSLGDGERLALMGPSGCGKTTLLRVALSLQPPDTGSVSGDPGRTAAVFQEPRLLPWRTAAENVNVVLSDTPDTMPEALSMLERVELSDAVEKYPAELSGGMQQRVSIARALAFRPDLLVLDEPFRGLDDELRGRIVSLLNTSLQSASLLLVTHSEEEAKTLGCRVLRYQDGRFV